MSDTQQISLTSEWFIIPGSEEAAIAALGQLALEVRSDEPGTLAYLVHTPYTLDTGLQSLPPRDPQSVLFFEVYENANAFHAHLNGPAFTGFVEKHGDLFRSANGKPYVTVNFLSQRAGFVRSCFGEAQAEKSTTVNQHPGVMFEVIAKDQAAIKSFYASVFDWTYETGTAGFAYIHFPAGSPPLLGGIGQALPDVAGMSQGTNFYLLVDKVQPFIDRAVAAGGETLMPPTPVDGYVFAMFKDVEGNPVGLIEPFAQ
ncbi:antibiotic biosynthesis monooxygenase [Sedimentitalea sp.]|uniref:antibiotic biosynthesis monooxygenase n=1 Tax=Sedimentitalea sp. TaxID=2048915 RepID=UPI003296E57F